MAGKYRRLYFFEVNAGVHRYYAVNALLFQLIGKFFNCGMAGTRSPQFGRLHCLENAHDAMMLRQ
jgi:hypothetical protein